MQAEPDPYHRTSGHWSDLRQVEALEQGMVRIRDAVELAPDGALGARPRARVAALVLGVRVNHDGHLPVSRRDAPVAHLVRVRVRVRVRARVRVRV